VEITGVSTTTPSRTFQNNPPKSLIYGNLEDFSILAALLLLRSRDLKNAYQRGLGGWVPARLHLRNENKSDRFAGGTRIVTTKTARAGHMNWDQIAGRRDQLIGRLQVRYGIAKEEASKQVDEFVSSLKPKVKEMKRAAHQS